MYFYSQPHSNHCRPQSLRSRIPYPAHRCLRSAQAKTRKAKPNPCTLPLRNKKACSLHNPHNHNLGLHRPRVPPLQRLPPIPPSPTWRKIWRRIHLSHLPEFAHHRVPGGPGRHSRRVSRRGPPPRPKGHARIIHNPNRRVLICKHDRFDEQFVTGVELRV
jgi:hypothetical protein